MGNTWFRGEGVGVAPATAGKLTHDFVDGVYFADTLEGAKPFARMRAPDPKDQRLYQVNVEMNSMRVLNLKTDPRWDNYMKEPVSPVGGMSRMEFLKQMPSAEHYNSFFNGFLKTNKIDLNQYDAVVGPLIQHGGYQLCIMHKNGAPSEIAKNLRRQFAPVGGKPSGPGTKTVPYGQAGRGGAVSPLGQPTPGFNPEGSHLKAMGGIIALGNIVGWLDEYFIDEAQRKDVADWEKYLRDRQIADPSIGFLLVVIIKSWQPRDAAYSTRSYMGIEKAEAETVHAAIHMARKNILPGLPVPTDTTTYEYLHIWYPPLKPKPAISSAEADEKAHGSEFWFPGFKRLNQSLEHPPDYAEALSVLVGSWMAAMIRMLDHLASYNPRRFAELKEQLRYLREPINRARVGLAFRAVEAHRSESSFGLSDFLKDYQTKSDYDMLPPDQQREIADWVERGSGAQQHVMQGQWEILMAGKKYLYSFKLSGSVIYRTAESPGQIGGEGKWSVSNMGVRIDWPKTGTVEYFAAPLRTENQPAKSVTKWGGTMDILARKISPYP